jgi:predicted dehydrogenase
MSKNSINRRDFISNAAVIGAAGALGGSALFTSCGNNNKTNALVPLRPEAEWNIPQEELSNRAKDGKPLKAGLIGCGGRGTGAAMDFMNAAPNVSIVALGDMFPDRLGHCRNVLKDTFSLEIPDDKCFLGFDSYKKVIDAGVDVVIIAMPVVFYPSVFKYAVNAGKHVFMEKPVAVDPVGARSIIADSRKAQAQGLCVVTGVQRHHQRCYIESYKQVQSGMIGDIVSGNVYWNGGELWHRKKEKGWTDMEWMLRDWVNWNWLCGDAIVERNVHNIDVFNWFSHMKPVKCIGFGGRHRRVTGDLFDLFSIDFTYERNIHMHSMVCQIPGASANVIEIIHGTKGTWFGGDWLDNPDHQKIVDLQGNLLWKYDYEKEKNTFEQTNPYILEHVDLINHIRDNKSICQAEDTAISTMTAIMGRISAYSCVEVTWDEMMHSDMNLMPDNLEFRDMDMTQFAVPVPGKV